MSTETCKIKHENYLKLVRFVRYLATERPDRDNTMEWINEISRDLLKEIEEN